MERKEMRKGPWTEQEDVQLVLYVNLFGDRRWDFIAKVSGLNRTGKSCRLRWVNYLHPGLKRGKMTSHEERLVLELHSKYGNRWSRIARKLPGRTDNEIKNYWRTLMRKKALERKKTTSPPSSSSSSSSTSSNSSSSSTSNSSTDKMTEFTPVTDANNPHTSPGEKKTDLAIEESPKAYSMDDIWKDFEFSEESCRTTSQIMGSPTWDYCHTSDSLWSIDEEQSNVLMQPMGDLFSYFPFS